jgi:hypothetical protein
VAVSADQPVAPKKQLGESETAMEACTNLENELAELKAGYEQYFLGVERAAPLKRHDALKKRINVLKNQFVRQTAVKFRIQNLSQKLVTYERLWERTLKEIENGSYRRDLVRARRHAQSRKTKEPNQPPQDDVDLNFDVDENEDVDLGDFDEDPPKPGADFAELDELDSALDRALGGSPKTASQPLPQPVAVQRPATTRLPAGSPLVGGQTGSHSTAAMPNSPGAAHTAAPEPSPAVTPSRSPTGTHQTATSGARPALGATAPSTTGARPSLGATAVTSTGARPALGGPTTATSGARPSLSPPSTARPAADPAASLNDQKIKAIYDAYVSAKKQCGEDTKNMTLDSVASTLRKQVPELMKQHNAKSVEFRVVIRDGKAVLRAVPKDE